MPGLIKEVVKGSIAEELGIEAGDELISINGYNLRDIIDYRFYSADEELELEIKKPNNDIWQCLVEKDIDEEIGIYFTSLLFDGLHACYNNCIFCFMDQLQPDARKSLLIKDDDYRLSFLEGNFITGTNLQESDLQRIEMMHLSPLYFSVQSTDSALRKKLLRNKNAGNIIQLLERLKNSGIEYHTQLVLCPGINDGYELQKSLKALSELRPNLLSVSIVPVGLTKFQKNKDLKLYDREKAIELVSYIENLQEEIKKSGEENYIYLADEFYLLSGKDIPPYEHYGDYSQFENGVGMTRLFWHEWQELAGKLPQSVRNLKRLAIITGKSGKAVFEPIIKDLKKVKGLQVELIDIENTFFGNSVTVSGLLTGTCVFEALKDKKISSCLLMPGNMLKFGDNLFLDSTTPDDLQSKLSTKILMIEPDAASLYNAIFEQGDNL